MSYALPPSLGRILSVSSAVELALPRLPIREPLSHLLAPVEVDVK
jgi:hypothetical protein